MNVNLNQVWELIDNLTLDEKKIIYKRMEHEINSKLLDILDVVNERAKLDSISPEEITKEIEVARRDLYGKN